MWPNGQETTDLVAFTEEIINGRRHFLRNATYTFFTVNLFKPVIIKFKMRFQP